MKPSWILSILLAMVGTGFGQDCFVGASKGIPTCDEGGLCRCLLSEGHNSKAPTTVELEPLGKEYQGGMIYYASGPLCRLKKGGGLACLDDDGNLMPEWTMSGGDQPKASFTIPTIAEVPCQTRDGKELMVATDQLGKCMYNLATFDEWDKWHEDIDKALTDCKRLGIKKAAIFDPIFQEHQTFSCTTLKKVFGQ